MELILNDNHSVAEFHLYSITPPASVYPFVLLSLRKIAGVCWSFGPCLLLKIDKLRSGGPQDFRQLADRGRVVRVGTHDVHQLDALWLRQGALVVTNSLDQSDIFVHVLAFITLWL